MHPDELIEYLIHEANRINIDLASSFPINVIEICEYAGAEYHEEILPNNLDGMYVVSDTGKGRDILPE